MAPDPALLLYIKLLLLVGIANGAPLVGHTVLRHRFHWPVDGKRRFIDGRPLFGSSKTWRGILLALAVTPVAALLLDLGASTGLIIGIGSMLGDLLSSFIKRRLGLTSSSQALGIDQIPESLLPLLAVSHRYALGFVEIATMVAAFIVLELLLSRLLFKLHLRDQPY